MQQSRIYKTVHQKHRNFDLRFSTIRPTVHRENGVVRFSMINKVAITHCSFLRLQIKREDISTNSVSVTKTEVYTILRDVCIVSRDVCIVSNRLTCVDSKLSEMEILAQPLSLPFIIENLMEWRKVPRYI
jgi:hypothetical protein